MQLFIFFMGKFINNKKISIYPGTILFDGKTNTNFTLKDDISNYAYLEIFYNLHPWFGQESTRISLANSKRAHLSTVHRANNEVSMYEVDMQFKGKNVTVSGCTKVVGGALIEQLEGSIYRVIGY